MIKLSLHEKGQQNHKMTLIKAFMEQIRWIRQAKNLDNTEKEMQVAEIRKRFKQKIEQLIHNLY